MCLFKILKAYAFLSISTAWSNMEIFLHLTCIFCFNYFLFICQYSGASIALESTAFCHPKYTQLQCLIRKHLIEV